MGRGVTWPVVKNGSGERERESGRTKGGKGVLRYQNVTSEPRRDGERQAGVTAGRYASVGQGE